MTSKKPTSNKKTNVESALLYSGLGVYIISTVVFSILLFAQPEGFNVRLAMFMLIVMLFIGGLGPAYRIASRAKTKLLTIVGSISLAVLFIFPAFFLVVALGWSIANTYV